MANACGGLLSIALLGFFAYVLVDMTLKIVNYDDIETKERMESNILETKTENIDLFAIEI